MMRKILGIIVSTSILLGSSFGSIASASTIKQAVSSVEQRTDIESTDMYTNIYTQDVLASLYASCDEASLTKGKAFIEAGKRILNKRAATATDASTLLYTYSLYEKLHDIQFEKVGRYEGAKYCKVKIFIYGLMQYLRENHVDIMKNTGIINDFDGYEGSIINGYNTKIATLQAHNKAYGQYKQKLGADFTYTYDDMGFFEAQNDQNKALLSETEQLMKNMVSYSMYELKKDGIIDQTDIVQLKDKMNIEYGAACNLFHGRYEIKQTLDSKGNHISYETQQFTIKVNLCPSYFVIRDMPEIFQRIITHELAHHIYYYKDTNTKAFENICWDAEDQKNALCSSENDFVTPYAQTAAVEDYAEHFMHWYLDRIETDTYFIKQKSAHFDKLF